MRFVWFSYYKTANRTIPCGAVRCTVTCGAVQLCHFASGFCGLLNTPKFNHLSLAHKKWKLSFTPHSLLQLSFVFEGREGGELRMRDMLGTLLLE